MNDLKEKPTQITVAKINNTEIVVVENGEKMIAVKPICEALGVAFEPQFTKLKTDPILSSVVMLSVTTGADGKQYEMVTIPFMYVFGWLFRIDSRNVKEEARETVLKYQIECYNALYNHFTGYADFVEQRQRLIEEHLTLVEAINLDFHEAKNRLIEAKAELNRARKLTFADYDAEKRQLKLFTTNEMEG